MRCQRLLQTSRDAAQIPMLCSYFFAEPMMRCQHQFSSQKHHIEAMLFSRFLVWKWQFLNLYVELFAEDLHFIKLENLSLFSLYVSLPAQKAQPLWCKDDMLRRCCHSQTNLD
jgi:hypothetical protein